MGHFLAVDQKTSIDVVSHVQAHEANVSFGEAQHQKVVVLLCLIVVLSILETEIS